MTERPPASPSALGGHATPAGARSRRNFARRLSHALRGDISALRLALDVARQRIGPLTPGARDPLARLEATIAQFERREQDLSLLTHAEAGSLELHRGGQRLRWVIEHAVREYREMANKCRVRLSVELGDCETRSLALDRARMVRALGAVLDNAIRYSPLDGLVTIHVEMRNDLARITVRDQGAGFAPGDGRRVFRPFVVGGDGGPASSGRLGMGLAVARAIVVAHGGHIRIARSRRPGGSVVIELPLA